MKRVASRGLVAGICLSIFSLAASGVSLACSDRDPVAPQVEDPDSWVGLGGAGGAPPKYDDSPDAEPPEELKLEFRRIVVPKASGATDIEFFPDRPEFLITLREGHLLYGELQEDGSAITLATWKFAEEMLTIDACGPTNVLLDPDFDDNHFIYVTYCRDTEVTRLVRYEFSPIVGPTNPAVIFETDIEYLDEWHRFGSMGFEEGGVLWFFLGDHFHREEGQDFTTPFGALHRIIPNRDPDGEGYQPAPSNMTAEDLGQGGSGGDPFPSMYAYGFRSPWRGTRDSLGRYWVGDVGLEAYEEVNLVSTVGQNFGWGTHEGPCQNECDGYTGPVVSYDRSDEHTYSIEDSQAIGGSRRAIWLGQIYEDPKVDRYQGLMDGVVVFGDLFTGWVRALRADEEGQIVMNEPVGHLESVTQWKVAPDGYAYALNLSGELHVALLVTQP